MPDAPLRLVVVDNDPAVLELVLLDLRLEGHQVVATASNGEGAVRACTEADPDVAVVDLRLGPGIDGIEVARRIGRPGRRVILYTNYISPAVIRAAERAGATVVEKGNLSTLRRAVVG